MAKKDNFWHFIRKSERIKVQSFEVSKVIDSKFKEQSKLPVMDKQVNFSVYLLVFKV